MSCCGSGCSRLGCDVSAAPERSYRFELEFAYRTTAQSNRRGHWSSQHKKIQNERNALRLAWLAGGKPRPPIPIRVTFTRISPRKLDLGDNLPSAFKGMRDEVCACLGVSDSASAPVEFLYRQLKPEEANWNDGRYGVRVLLEHNPTVLEAYQRRTSC